MKITEGGHKAGCKCGFCANKGKLGKKADDDTKAKDDKKESTAESLIRRKTATPAPRTESRRASKIVSSMLDS